MKIIETKLKNGVFMQYDSEWKSAEQIISHAATMAQMKELDRHAIEDLGVPSLWLMENAAAAVVHRVVDIILYKRSESVVDINRKSGTVTIVCGAGNNGGDGVACAYMLINKGFKVKAYLCGKDEKMTPDEREMEKRLVDCGGSLIRMFGLNNTCDCIKENTIDSVKDNNDFNQETFSSLISDIKHSDCVIDALFGVGISRVIGEPYAQVIEAINDAADTTTVVSCDIPSGINGDTGEVMGVAVKADVTVTFSRIKRGLMNEGTANKVGTLVVVPIGLPE